MASTHHRRGCIGRLASSTMELLLQIFFYPWRSFVPGSSHDQHDRIQSCTLQYHAQNAPIPSYAFSTSDRVDTPDDENGGNNCVGECCSVVCSRVDINSFEADKLRWLVASQMYWITKAINESKKGRGERMNREFRTQCEECQ
jgi:hypothetical protein